MSVCDQCHEKQHKNDRSELTKIGIEKIRTGETPLKDVLISQINLLEKILILIEDLQEDIRISDIIDAIIDAPIKKKIYDKG